MQQPSYGWEVQYFCKRSKFIDRLIQLGRRMQQYQKYGLFLAGSGNFARPIGYIFSFSSLGKVSPAECSWGTQEGIIFSYLPALGGEPFIPESQNPQKPSSPPCNQLFSQLRSARAGVEGGFCFFGLSEPMWTAGQKI